MEDFIRADKPYAVTAADAEGNVQVVSPKDPRARQILAHYVGQEVPTMYMIRAGLADKEGVATPKDYAPAPVVAPTETATPAGYISAEQAEKDKQDAIAKAVADALAAAKKTPAGSGNTPPAANP